MFKINDFKIIHIWSISQTYRFHYEIQNLPTIGLSILISVDIYLLLEEVGYFFFFGQHYYINNNYMIYIYIYTYIYHYQCVFTLSNYYLGIYVIFFKKCINLMFSIADLIFTEIIDIELFLEIFFQLKRNFYCCNSNSN